MEPETVSETKLQEQPLAFIENMLSAAEPPPTDHTVYTTSYVGSETENLRTTCRGDRRVKTGPLTTIENYVKQF